MTSPDAGILFILFSTDKMGESLHRFSGFTTSVYQLRPESRGSIHINSADPFTAPTISANYLSSETDRKTLVDALKKTREIMRAPAMKPYLAEEVEPGPAIVSDDDLLAFCRRISSTIYHPSSTCTMGNDDTAVVTPGLKVIGVEGLRVVDGSVMPRLVSGNCNAAIIMIAEKAADMVLADTV